MYLRQPHFHFERPKRQQGFLIPVALFIVVGLGVLAVSIARLSSGTQTAVIREALSVQALFASESGGQYALNQLLFNASTQSVVDTRCTAVDSASVDFTAVGLTGCSVSLACAIMSNTGGGAHIYTIQSTSTCGSGDLETQRIISIKASFE